jgi:hypothetical protein
MLWGGQGRRSSVIVLGLFYSGYGGMFKEQLCWGSRRLERAIAIIDLVFNIESHGTDGNFLQKSNRTLM